MMYAAAVGFVWHKLNPRLTTLHLADMINEAEDKLLTLAANMLPLLEEVARLRQCLERISVPDAEQDAPYKRALAHAAVGQVAVIGRSRSKRRERPLMIVGKRLA